MRKKDKKKNHAVTKVKKHSSTCKKKNSPAMGNNPPHPITFQMVPPLAAKTMSPCQTTPETVKLKRKYYSSYLMLPTSSGSRAYSQSYVSSSFSVVVRTRNLHCLVRIEKTLNVWNATHKSNLHSADQNLRTISKRSKTPAASKENIIGFESMVNVLYPRNCTL